MSTHNIYFHGEIKKKLFCGYPHLSAAVVDPECVQIFSVHMIHTHSYMNNLI